MGVLSERGFIFDVQDDNLGLPSGIRSIIQGLKWVKLYQHPGAYNIPIVKELYSNLIE